MSHVLFEDWNSLHFHVQNHRTALTVSLCNPMAANPHRNDWQLQEECREHKNPAILRLLCLLAANQSGRSSPAVTSMRQDASWGLKGQHVCRMVMTVNQTGLMDEAQLVSRSLAGDRNAFEEIVRRNLSPVEATAFALMGNSDDSEDVAQEVFVTAWQKLRQLEQPGKLKAWLCAMARNAAKSRWRKRDPLRGAATLDEATQTASTLTPSPSEAASTAERRRIAWQAIADMPEDYRLPLVLFYREGQSIREVASALDVSEDTVRQRLSRGRAMLRTEVTRMVEDSLQGPGPGPLVVAGIMAGIAATGSHAAAAGTLAATAAKSGVTLSTGGLIGALGGAILGPIIGIAGGILGARASLRQARSPEERDEIKRLIVRTLILVAVWLVGLSAIIGAGISRILGTEVAMMAGGALLIAYLGALFALIFRAQARIRELRPEPATPPDRRPFLVQMQENMRANPRQWFYALLGSYGGSIFGSTGWLLAVCAIHGDTLGFATTLSAAALLTGVCMWSSRRWPQYFFLHIASALLILAGFTAVAAHHTGLSGVLATKAQMARYGVGPYACNGVTLYASAAILAIASLVLFIVHYNLHRKLVASRANRENW